MHLRTDSKILLLNKSSTNEGVFSCPECTMLLIIQMVVYNL